MKTVSDLIKADYHDRLQAAGIPIKTSKRTPAQQTAAASLFWGAKSQAIVDSTSITQAAVEGNQ